MAEVFPKNAFTKSVTFPKILLAVEYVIQSNENTMFFSKHETYDSEEVLIQEAHQNTLFLGNNSKHLHATNVIVIPLLLKTTRTQKKSYWTTVDEAPVVDWFFYKQVKVSAMLNDFQNYHAVITCGSYDKNKPEFFCAGYYPSGDKKLEEEVIKKSQCPADPLVKDYAIYEIIKPYRYSLDDELLKTLN